MSAHSYMQTEQQRSGRRPRLLKELSHLRAVMYHSCHQHQMSTWMSAQSGDNTKDKTNQIRSQCHFSCEEDPDLCRKTADSRGKDGAHSAESRSI